MATIVVAIVAAVWAFPAARDRAALFAVNMKTRHGAEVGAIGLSEASATIVKRFGTHQRATAP